MSGLKGSQTPSLFRALTLRKAGQRGNATGQTCAESVSTVVGYPARGCGRQSDVWDCPSSREHTLRARPAEELPGGQRGSPRARCLLPCPAGALVHSHSQQAHHTQTSPPRLRAPLGCPGAGPPCWLVQLFPCWRCLLGPGAQPPARSPLVTRPGLAWSQYPVPTIQSKFHSS